MPTANRSSLNDSFMLDREDGDGLAVFYAPFDYVNTDARLVLAGVTPGWTQMEISFLEARTGIEAGLSDQEILRTVKRVAAFFGTMRKTFRSQRSSPAPVRRQPGGAPSQGRKLVSRLARSHEGRVERVSPRIS